VIAGLSAPLEVIKVQLQLDRLNALHFNRPSIPGGSVARGIHILRSEGPLPLYRGVSLHLLRDSFGTGEGIWLP
jgi:hypothetical protein